VISIAGQKHWLWRAVDQDGYVLDEIVQRRRNTKAAKRLLTRLMKKQGMAPKRIITDDFGTVLLSLQEARTEAIRTAGAILRDEGDRFRNGTEWQMSVTDAAGQSVLELRFSTDDQGIAPNRECKEMPNRFDERWDGPSEVSVSLSPCGTP